MVKIKKITIKKKKRKVGFLARKKTKAGKKILLRRLRKKRKNLAS